MKIDLNVFREYSNVNLQSKTNLIVNGQGNGLTTTKARGGVNMLAGLLNIGTRARYGRETLDALKDALKSEIKSQTDLSDQECMNCVNTAFNEAFNMNFDTARSKALKLNPQMVRKVLDSADKQIQEKMSLPDAQSPKFMKIDTLFANSMFTDNAGHKTLPRNYVNDKYGFQFSFFTTDILPKIKNDLNTVVLTRTSRDFVIRKLKGHIKDIGCLNGEGKSQIEDPKKANWPKLDELKQDIINRLQNRITELGNMNFE